MTAIINAPIVIIIALALALLVFTAGLALLKAGAKPLPKIGRKR